MFSAIFRAHTSRRNLKSSLVVYPVSAKSLHNTHPRKKDHALHTQPLNQRPQKPGFHDSSEDNPGDDDEDEEQTTGYGVTSSLLTSACLFSSVMLSSLKSYRHRRKIKNVWTLEGRERWTSMDC